jgi:hypothetical protein
MLEAANRLQRRTRADKGVDSRESGTDFASVASGPESAVPALSTGIWMLALGCAARAVASSAGAPSAACSSLSSPCVVASEASEASRIIFWSTSLSRRPGSLNPLETTDGPAEGDCAMIRSRAIDWRLLMLGKQDASRAGGDGEMLAAAGLPAAARCVLVFQDTTLGRRVNSVPSPLSLLARLASWGAACFYVVRARAGI